MPDEQPTSPEPLQWKEAASRILAAGEGLGGELGGATKAFGALVAAELALSRSALLRVVVLTSVGIILGTTAWLYAMAVAVLGLRAMGLVWWAAVGIPALLSLLAALLCLWLAGRTLDDARFIRTRRVLARLRGGVGNPESVTGDGGQT